MKKQQKRLICGKIFPILFLIGWFFVFNAKQALATVTNTNLCCCNVANSSGQFSCSGCFCGGLNPTGTLKSGIVIDVANFGFVDVTSLYDYWYSNNTYTQTILKADFEALRAGMVSCGGDLTCQTAIATVFEKKMQDAQKAVINNKIATAGLDKTKANTAVETCAGDLVCIDKVLTALQLDSSYASSSTTNTSNLNTPLTAASLSDLINTNNSTNANNIVNQASNTQGVVSSNPPSVSLQINSAGVSQVGGKMVATATPGYFKSGSNADSLYFTWYLKREGCDLGSKATARCDLDGDNKITVNDWKIAAAKILIAGSFDQAGVDYTRLNGISAKDGGFLAVPEIDKQKGNLDVGWRNGFLRDGNNNLYQSNTDSSEVANCYVQVPSSGKTYELREVSSGFGGDCPSGYHRACVNNQTANCPVYNALNLNYQESFNVCGVTSEKTDNSDVFCRVKSDLDLKNFKATVACANSGEVSMCVKNDASVATMSNNMSLKSDTETFGILVGTKLGTTVGVDDTFNNKMCSAVAKQDTVNAGFFLSNTNPLFSSTAESCSVLKEGFINGKTDSAGNTIIFGNKNLEPKCNFQKSVNLCKHLFPVLPKEVKNSRGGQAVVGDGEFNIDEKAFWGADPAKISTTGKGVDEKIATGLGVNTFEWIYTKGDQIGVVVEGDSVLPSEHADNTYKRMWAFSNGTCKVLDELEKNGTIDPNDPTKNTRGFYLDGNYGILTAKLDLNDCLEENLIDPQLLASNNLTVQLVSDPTNPINDSTGRGDVLNVSATSLGSQDSGSLLYNWSIQLSRDGSMPPMESTNWKEITGDLVKNSALSATDLMGLGKNKLAINLNLSDNFIKSNVNGGYDDIFYLKIKVKTTGTATDGNQSADGSLIVKIRAQQNEILVYPVIASVTGMLSMDTAKKSEICSTVEGKIRCFVTKNEIIGLNIPNPNNKLANFTWKINGVATICDGNISSQCVGNSNNLFFPVLGNEGEAVDVVATALNTKTNETIEVSRHFIITGTQIMLSSGDTNIVWPKLLGYYKDLNGNRYADYSDSVYEARQGSVASLVANFGGNSEIAWTIDGEQQYNFANQKEMTFPIDKEAGLSYNINLTASYKPGSELELNNLRKALLKNWNITPEDSIVEENKEVNIQINVLPSAQASVVRNLQNGFASLLSYLPERILFLFQLILTGGGLLLLTGVIFAVMPETALTKKTN